MSRASKDADTIVGILEARFRAMAHGLETLEGAERERAGDLAIAFASVLCEVTPDADAWAERIRFVITTVNAPKHRRLNP